MAAGGADSWKIECQWDGTTWVDETAYLIGHGDAVTITRGRATEADDIQTGVLSAAFDNVTGRFTPDSPLSPLYPYIEDGVPIRFSLVKGGVTYWRHWGRFAAGEPQMGPDGPASAVLPFQSVGLLGKLAGRTLRSDYIERWLDETSTWDVDIWPMDGPGLPNLGNGGGVGQIIPEATGAGTWTFGSPDGLMHDSAVTVSLAGSRSPRIRLRVGPGVTTTKLIEFAFRTPDRTPTTAGSSLTIASGFDSAGAAVWTLQLKDNAGQTDVNVYDSAGAFLATLYSGFSAIGDTNGDDQWFVFTLVNQGGTQFAALNRVVDGIDMGVTAIAQDCTTTRTIYLGFQVNASFGPCVVATAEFGESRFLGPNGYTTSQKRFADLNTYADFASTTHGSEKRIVWRKDITGRTVFDVAAEVTRTVGSTITEFRDQEALDYWDSDTLRKPSPVLTVDIRADGGEPPPFRKGEIPSSVTASWPGGSITYTDSSRVRVDASIDTCAFDENGARDAAAFLVNRSRKLRLTRLVVDLATGTNDLWTSAMALEVGDRIRVTLGSSDTDPLVTHFGAIYVDVYAMGWTEVHGDDIARLEIDCVPADDPVEGEIESATRGRLGADGTMTVTGGGAIGNTANGTLVITTTAGFPALTVDPASYPLNLDWNGERVTITSPPASSTSPQTVTTTTRGLSPSVARVHVANEPVDISYAPSFTI